MPSKTRRLSYLDLPAAQIGAPASVNNSDDVTGGAIVLVGPPLDVVLTSGVVHSNAAPASYIAIAWSPPDTQSIERPDRYTVQVSTSTSFTASGTLTLEVSPSDRDAPSTIVNGLPTASTQYVRLRAIVKGYPGEWSSMSPLVAGENYILTAEDLTAAGVPASVSATWIGLGDLLVTWVNPVETNFKDVELVVRASSGGTIYRTTYSAVGRFLYTLSMNLQDTIGVGDPSLYVELRSRTFNNVFSTTVNTGLVTKAAPATPASVSQSWSGDTGTAGADLTLTWAAQVDAATFQVSMNSQTARRVAGTTYTYPFSRNVADNGTNGDPSLTYSIQALDGFGQASTAASGSATNAAPAAPSLTLEQGAVGGLFITVTSTPPLDFWRNEYVIKRDSTTVATVYSAGATTRYEMQGASDGGYHSWTVVARVEDLFAQFSSTTTPAAVVVETLTLQYLRDDIVYSDSIGTAAATLKAALADGVVTSGGISYSA